MQSVDIIDLEDDFIKKCIVSNAKVLSINSKKDLLMESLTKFFNNVENLNYIVNIINGKSKISLRILDWFVTNYSKKNNIRYVIDKTKKNFIVYLDYKAQLKAYSKKQFDPFCRRERISLLDHTDNEIITTVGQLNFFRWAIENKILDYIERNYDYIEKDMNLSLKEMYKKKDTNETNNEKKQRRRRRELSISATKSINKHDVTVIVKFD